MQVRIALVLLQLCVIGLISGCSKKDPSPTSLKISLIDSNNAPVTGANVKLYSTQTDWTNATNQIGITQVSDANGFVFFSNLSAIPYFWFAEKNCENNYNGISNSTALIASTQNSLESVMINTGTLAFNNSSSNPYAVYINGTLEFTALGSASYTISYAPTMAYTIRVLQQSGYLSTPTDETFTGTLNCGSTLTTSFP